MNLFKRIKLNLLEMSEDKAKLGSKIDNVTWILDEHLVKCLIYQNKTNTLNHWQHEIYSFLPRVPKLKGSNKYPSEKFLYNCTINIYSDALMDYLNSHVVNVQDKYGKVDNINKQGLYDCIIAYYKWLIPILSKNGAVTEPEVRAEINNLIKDYNNSLTKVGV